MAYTDLTTTFGYKVRIDRTNLLQLNSNDLAIQQFIPLHNRPALQFLSVTQVRFKANNRSGTDIEADILFPDGTQVQYLQNNPASKDIFDITLTADWTTGSPQGGLRPGLSEAANTWYALYAVRDPFDAVLVGDTTLPLQANVATLNTRYGSNRWVYLGMIRNGDGNLIASDILDFVMVRNRTYFKNKVDGQTLDCAGILLATGASVSGLTWAYSPGVGNKDIPDHLKFGIFDFQSAFDSVNNAKDFGSNHFLLDSGAPGAAASWHDRVWANTELGVRLDGASAVTRDIFFAAFMDNVLGLGYSAQI